MVIDSLLIMEYICLIWKSFETEMRAKLKGGKHLILMPIIMYYRRLHLVLFTILYYGAITIVSIHASPIQPITTSKSATTSRVISQDTILSTGRYRSSFTPASQYTRKSTRCFIPSCHNNDQNLLSSKKSTFCGDRINNKNPLYVCNAFGNDNDHYNQDENNNASSDEEYDGFGHFDASKNAIDESFEDMTFDDSRSRPRSRSRREKRPFVKFLDDGGIEEMFTHASLPKAVQ